MSQRAFRASSSLARRSSPIQSVAVSVEAPLEFVRPREPKPEWLKVRAPGSENYLRLKGIMKDLKLNTVCEDARCPNIGECWHHGTATFMILGDVCTRACAYCAVAHGRPTELDTAEPARVAEAVDAHAPAIRGHHVRRSRRSGRRRRVDLRGHDPADAGARARLPHRGADSRFPGHRIVAADRARRRPGRPQSQHRDGAAAVSDGALRREVSPLARAAGPLAARTGRTSPRRRASWSALARSTTSSSPSSTTCAAPASRSSRSVSTCGRRRNTRGWRATIIPTNSPS